MGDSSRTKGCFERLRLRHFGYEEVELGEDSPTRFEEKRDVPNSAIKLMLFPFSLAGAARHWLEEEPPRSILTWEDLASKFINEFFPPSRATNLRNEISNFQQWFDESFHEAWDRYKYLFRACPHYGFTELHQLDTFYNALNPADQDSLNYAAGGNLLERRTQDVLTIIENKSKVRNSRNKSIISQVKSSDANSSSSSEIAKLTHAVNQQTSVVTTVMTAILKQFQATPPPAFVKSVEEICVTCDGAHPYYQCLATDGNTFLEFRDNIQGYVSAAAVNYNQGNFGYRPLSVVNQIRPPGFAQLNVQNNQNRFSQPQGYNRGNNFNQDTSYQAPIQQNQVVPFSELEKIKKMNEINIKAMQTQINNEFVDELALIPFPSRNDDLPFNIESDLREIEYLLNHDPTKEMDSILEDSIDEENLADPNVDLFDTIPEMFTDKHTLDYSSPPLYDDFDDDLDELDTTSSSPDHFLKEFADELALITFPPRNDELPFDIESDLREIEYLLNHDPTKEMDSILEDSIDEDNLADPNDNLFDTIPEMFTNEHTLDYSSPPLYDDVDDDLFKLESDNDDVYNDPFDSKEDKIKESKFLIDELGPPRSSDFLPFPEYDSFLFEDFSEVDALLSTNNEDKVFNPGILIHENLFEVTVQVTPDNNVKNISSSNASLILEDFNPPLYELSFHKEIPGSKTLLSFSSGNKKKVFKPGILTSEGVHTSLLPELSHRGPKAFKVINFFESLMVIFPCSYGEDIRILDVPCLHFYPP
nr:reverse transcriptase domain-containing protein [Tanacetum cinerariifolium]